MTSLQELMTSQVSTWSKFISNELLLMQILLESFFFELG